MRFSWRRSVFAEDRLDAWVQQRYEEHVLSGNATVAGPCPEQSFLKELVRKSRKISLSDPRVDHVATCPDCMARFLVLREQQHFPWKWAVLATATAACVLVLLALFLLPWIRTPRQTNMAAVSETVDLSNLATLRGSQPAHLKAVSLPAKKVKLTLLLPRFSPSGQYLIAVTRDPTGHQIIAAGTASSQQYGEYEEVIVALNLRNAAPGQYFLSTTHEQDESAYYYPLHIR